MGSDAPRHRSSRGRHQSRSPQSHSRKPRRRPASASQNSRSVNPPRGDQRERHPTAAKLSLSELGTSELLKNVSRTFFLSVRFLPTPLRSPIGLGYLLARALDTIADSPAASTEVRLKHLQAALEMFKLGTDQEKLQVLVREMAAKQTHPAEKQLLEQLPHLIPMIDQLDSSDRWDLLRALNRIGYGQTLDLKRFEDLRIPVSTNAEKLSSIRALTSEEELKDYAYYVAGSAGELWTRLCQRHLGHYTRLPKNEMLLLGKHFGQGLQLVNILRDLPTDLAAGRCYLPLEDLNAAGIASPEELLKHPQKAQPVFEKWIRIALEYLDDGWKYTTALRSMKLRYSCALPILLGVKTLALLAQQSPLEHGKLPQKVSRNEVKRLLVSTGFGMLSKGWLESLYQRERKKAVAGE